MGPWNGGMWNTIPGPYTSVFIGDNGVAPMLWPVPESVALSIAAFYRGVAIYADTLSTLPITTLRGSERIDDPSWLVHPAGSEVGWTDECAQVVWSLIMRGNAYAVPTSYGYDGYPTSFVVLNPDYVSLTLVAEGVLYSWTNIDGSTSSMLNPSGLDLLHIRLHRTPGNYLGLGVLDVAGGPFGTLSGVAATQRYATDVMANPSPPAVLNSALRLNKAQAEALQEQWADSVARARAIPAVLSGGITYQALNVTPRDVELIATRRWNATEIAVLLGLPPYLLGGDTGTSLTYSTTEAELSRLWILGLMPVAVAVERGFGAWVPRGQRIRFVPDAVLRAQTKDRYDAYKVGLDAGFLTIAEVRETEHLGELPEELMPSQDNPPPVSGLGEPVPAQSRPLPPAGPDQPSPNPPLPLAAVPGGN
jgi:HK97 family phage portal protein